MPDSQIFRPLTINGVTFENRVLRSSIGGRMSTYDGVVTDVWKNFEKRFADGGVGGIISTTFHVNRNRLSPLEYPSIADGKYVAPLRKQIAAVRRDRPQCRYIVQIGDPGYTTYTSLLPEELDAMSSSSGFDLAYGYNNRRRAMTDAQVEASVREFADAAARVRECGADGVEITATKAYLIHQFLNPGINRRNDRWGGDAERRFLFLERIVTAVRERVGRDYLLGIRLSAFDDNFNPLPLALLRWPPVFASREHWRGNDRAQMIAYAKRLRDLGVDYLHVVSGYGFPNPRDTPGPFPLEEIRMFFNSTRHLSRKAAVRATLLNLLPTGLARWVANIGWLPEGPEGKTLNLEDARLFRREVGLPVIANGGFQAREVIEGALVDVDMVSMARALIANPRLLLDFAAQNASSRAVCTFCNRCVGLTASSPLGCYNEARFPSRREMLEQIVAFNQADADA